LSFPIQNISKRDGTEVVQVYVKKLNDSDGPLKTLKAFKRISLKAGEKQNVTIDLLSSSFEFYDSKSIGMKVTPGEYEVYYGNSSDSKDLKRSKISIL
jgi:beta-glucosidase